MRRSGGGWFFFSAPWRHHEDEEEEEEVPLSHEDDVDHRPKDKEEEDHGGVVDEIKEVKEPSSGAEEAAGRSRSSSSSSRWRWGLVPPATRLVIGGLVALAVLLAAATTTTWWSRTHLDYSSSSFLLGSDSSNGRPYRDRDRSQSAAGANNQLLSIPFSCGTGNSNSSSSSSNGGQGQEPPSMAPLPSSQSSEAPPPRCPDYFRFIHSDLAPWRETGITREAVESGRPRAAFRLVVVGGRAFVETYHRVFQTRDTFTQWGIAQLLARYPGRVPDLDLMFNCEDMPEVRAADFPVRSEAPPLFRYCKDDSTLDIVFPDWSFWGWPELNIRPWAPLLEEMADETRRLPWTDRKPYAYWKGNPWVSRARQDLLRCNDSSSPNTWNVDVRVQDWDAAIRAGFRESNLAKQCTHRYKIFVQGRSWSVSEKYILACDSTTLLVATPFKDFFSRGLVAGKHYWPVDPKRMCPAIKFAVDWGNAHPAAAQGMAREGSGFARRDLAMDYVYDYMLHLLTEYARLLRYKPTVPDKAVELRPETIACPARERPDNREFDFMMQSRERYQADYEPCILPPPFTTHEFTEMARRDKQVRAGVNDMMLHAQRKGG